MTGKFDTDICAELASLAAAGLTLKDAAVEAGVGEKTLKNWLSRGRGEESGEYHDFAAQWDEAKQAAADREQPMDEAELLLSVSRSAKKGSVAAQKLLWEMLKATNDDDPDEDADPFDALDQEDELAKRRPAA